MRIQKLQLGLLLCLLGCNADESGSNESRPMGPIPAVVETSSGPVQGTLGEGVYVVKGMPYAAPPIENRRFEPPTQHVGWTTPLLASEFGPACPQPDSPISEPGEEDCLTLNIWAPNRLEPKPVMVWFHGGAFYLGSGGNAMYDGSSLAMEGDVVVVTLNYRLGLFGFLPVGTDEMGHLSMLGLLDQQQALKWVQANIASFGGDPNNVTIFGESAGGFSVCHHLGMESSDGLYHRAIIQSGGGCKPPKAAAAAEASAELFWRETQCEFPNLEDRLACAKTLALETILQTQQLMPKNALGLVNIEPFANEAPSLEGGLERRLASESDIVPVMIGSNLNEMTLFTTLGYVPVSDENDYEAALDLLGIDSTTKQAVRALYNEATHGSLKQAIESLGTDAVFTCPSLRFAHLSAQQLHPVFVYHFHLQLGHGLASLGATHGAEIPYVFNTADAGLGGLPLRIDIETDQVRRIQQLWSDFARDGFPTTTLEWPAFDDDSKLVMTMSDEWSLTADAYQERCDVLSDVTF
ncbi:MAG: carboxylesterase/lipase family protein [Bradymonadia bacterium]